MTKGVWVCNVCGHVVLKEAEVGCWKCGKTHNGEMMYTVIDAQTDIIALAMTLAVQEYSGICLFFEPSYNKDVGIFNASGFSQALTQLIGLRSGLDGDLVRAILSGRPDVEPHHPGNAHFRRISATRT
jgi:hypothetical protein